MTEEVEGQAHTRPKLDLEAWTLRTDARTDGKKDERTGRKHSVSAGHSGAGP